jgi:Flp pilus assembly protein TadG
VEFAIVLPLLLLLLFGIIEFSIVLYDKAILTNASREAAREGVVYSVPYMAASSVQGVAINNVSQNLISLGSSGNPTASVNPSTGCTTTGTPLTVTVSYSYTGLTLGASFNPLPSSLQNALALTASTTMNCE